MGTAQCQALQRALRQARARPARVIVPAGGPDHWSNGIRLNLIAALALGLVDARFGPDPAAFGAGVAQRAAALPRWRGTGCARPERPERVRLRHGAAARSRRRAQTGVALMHIKSVRSAAVHHTAMESPCRAGIAALEPGRCGRSALQGRSMPARSRAGPDWRHTA